MANARAIYKPVRAAGVFSLVFIKHVRAARSINESVRGVSCKSPTGKRTADDNNANYYYYRRLFSRVFGTKIGAGFQAFSIPSPVAATFPTRPRAINVVGKGAVRNAVKQAYARRDAGALLHVGLG